MFHRNQPAGTSIQPDHGARRTGHSKHITIEAEDAGARGFVGRPLGEPLQPEIQIEAVKVGHPREQAERVLTDEVAHRPALKLHHGGGDRGVTDGTRSIALEFAQGTVDDGEG